MYQITVKEEHVNGALFNKVYTVTEKPEIKIHPYYGFKYLEFTPVNKKKSIRVNADVRVYHKSFYVSVVDLETNTEIYMVKKH